MFQMFTSVKAAQQILHIGFVTPDVNTGQELRKVVAARENIDLALIESSSVTAKSNRKELRFLPTTLIAQVILACGSSIVSCGNVRRRFL